MVEHVRLPNERLKQFSLASHTTQSATPKSGQMKTDAGWKCHKSMSQMSQTASTLTSLPRLPCSPEAFTELH